MVGLGAYDLFFNDYEIGCALTTDVGKLPPDNELHRLFTNRTLIKDSLPFAIKYFKERHSGYLDTGEFQTLVYPNKVARGCTSKERLARYLGIPRRTHAMALMAYLVSIDGKFTESALATAKLFDKGGKRINAVHTDAGLTLSVLKERDATDGWHHVVLNKEAAEIVLKWIAVTTPLRNYMKTHNIEGWQNLFVYTGNPLGKPAYFTRTSNINSAFRHFAISHKEKLGHLAEYVTIPRIRSTRGVIVFMENMNLAEMASELGNTNETSLRHYLPDSLWEYFSIRWIRIFQNLLIVEATKNTPYLQRALRFRSAEEMDEFLKTHALKQLFPENKMLDTVHDRYTVETFPTNSNQPNELMVVASPDIFYTLLSMTEAVHLALGKGMIVRAQASYWAEFTMRIKAHIESDRYTDRSIKQMLSNATTTTEPENFMEAVCD